MERFAVTSLAAIFLFAFASYADTDPLIQNYDVDFGAVPVSQRKTIQLFWHSDVNALSQTVGQVRVSGSSDFHIENDGCSGASIPNGSSCFFDIVFSPSTPGFKIAVFSYDWTNRYRDPGTGDVSSGSGTINFHTYGDTCELSLSMSFSKETIPPKLTHLDNSMEVRIQLSEASGATQCLSGHKIFFESEPVAQSGGHIHTGNRPVGTFKEDFCITDENGFCSTKYEAGIVGGTETIIAIPEEDPSLQISKNIEVKYPGLEDFRLHVKGRIGRKLLLVGKTPIHVENHYILPKNVPCVLSLADSLYEYYGAAVQLNDMSLSNGGIFDLHANWSPPEHDAHRRGLSVDINRCGLITTPNNPFPSLDCNNNKYVRLDKALIGKFCSDLGGHLEKEVPIHCEFSACNIK